MSYKTSFLIILIEGFIFGLIVQILSSYSIHFLLNNGMHSPKYSKLKLSYYHNALLINLFSEKSFPMPEQNKGDLNEAVQLSLPIYLMFLSSLL